MKITIETTPQELAELIFALVDCDFEVEDDEEEEFDTEEDDDADDAVIRRAKLDVANTILTALTRALHKTAT